MGRDGRPQRLWVMVTGRPCGRPRRLPHRDGAAAYEGAATTLSRRCGPGCAWPCAMAASLVRMVVCGVESSFCNNACLKCDSDNVNQKTLTVVNALLAFPLTSMRSLGRKVGRFHVQTKALCTGHRISARRSAGCRGTGRERCVRRCRAVVDDEAGQGTQPAGTPAPH